MVNLSLRRTSSVLPFSPRALAFSALSSISVSQSQEALYVFFQRCPLTTVPRLEGSQGEVQDTKAAQEDFQKRSAWTKDEHILSQWSGPLKTPELLDDPYSGGVESAHKTH